MVRRGQFQSGPLNPSRRIDGLGQPHDAAYLYWLRLWDERREGSEWIRYPGQGHGEGHGLVSCAGRVGEGQVRGAGHHRV